MNGDLFWVNGFSDTSNVLWFNQYICLLEQGAANSINSNAESRIFWFSLVVTEAFWIVFVFVALLTINFKWFVSIDNIAVLCKLQFLTYYFTK